MADSTMSSFDWIGTAYTEIGIRVKERSISLPFFNPRAFDRYLKRRNRGMSTAGLKVVYITLQNLIFINIYLKT